MPTGVQDVFWEARPIPEGDPGRVARQRPPAARIADSGIRDHAADARPVRKVGRLGALHREAQIVSGTKRRSGRRAGALRAALLLNGAAVLVFATVADGFATAGNLLNPRKRSSCSFGTGHSLVSISSLGLTCPRPPSSGSAKCRRRPADECRRSGGLLAWGSARRRRLSPWDSPAWRSGVVNWRGRRHGCACPRSW